MFGWLGFGKRAKNAALSNAPKFSEDGFYQFGVADAEYRSSSAIWACVQRISQRVGQARFHVADADGAAVDGHPLNALLAMPSARLPRHNFYAFLAESVLTDGNAYAVKQGGGNGEWMINYPIALRAVPAGFTQIISNSADTLDYEFVLQLAKPGGTSRTINARHTDVVHVRGNFYDIATGFSLSPVRTAAAASIELNRLGIESSSQYLQNSKKFSGVINTQIPLLESASLDEYQAQVDSFFKGVRGHGAVLRLPFGHEYRPSPNLGKDMMLADQLNWSVSDIARIYGVPLAMIQHTAGQRPSVEELEDALLRDAVMPLCCQISAALNERLLTAADRMRMYEIKADLSMFAVPTMSGKAAWAMSMAQSGVLTTNEIRRKLGFAPIDGGDELPSPAGAPDRQGSGQMPESDEELDSEMDGG